MRGYLVQTTKGAWPRSSRKWLMNVEMFSVVVLLSHIVEYARLLAGNILVCGIFIFYFREVFQVPSDFSLL